MTTPPGDPPRRARPVRSSGPPMPGAITVPSTSTKPEPSASLIAIGIALLLLGGVVAAWATHDYIYNFYRILDGHYANPTVVPIVIGALIHLAGWITAAVGAVRAAQGVDYLVKAHTPQSAVRRTPRRTSPPPNA